MTQMTSEVPPESNPAPAHESLVLRASIFPMAQPTEDVAGPGLPSWPTQARDIPGSLQGPRLPGARKGESGDGSDLEPHRGCSCPSNPHRRGKVTGASHGVGQAEHERSQIHRLQLRG